MRPVERALVGVLADYRQALITGRPPRGLEHTLCKAAGEVWPDVPPDCTVCPLGPEDKGCTQARDLIISAVGIANCANRWPKVLAVRYFALRARAARHGIPVPRPETDE